MDYKKWIDDLKELIEYLRYSDDEYRLCELKLKSSISIIETLLTERDAALEELRGICWCCANGKSWEKAGPLSNLTACEHLAERGILACGGRSSKCQHWQWRGPQKEGGE